MKRLLSGLCLAIALVIASATFDASAATLKKVTDVETVVDENSIKVTWDNSNKKTSFTKFIIYRSTDGGKFERVGSCKKSRTNFVDKNVEEGKSYSYKIKVYDGETKSYSKASSVETINEVTFATLELPVKEAEINIEEQKLIDLEAKKIEEIEMIKKEKREGWSIAAEEERLNALAWYTKEKNNAERNISLTYADFEQIYREIALIDQDITALEEQISLCENKISNIENVIAMVTSNKMDASEFEVELRRFNNGLDKYKTDLVEDQKYKEALIQDIETKNGLIIIWKDYSDECTTIISALEKGYKCAKDTYYKYHYFGIEPVIDIEFPTI